MAVALPPLALHESTNPDKIDAPEIAAQWFKSFAAIIEKQQWSALPDVLVEEVWWRDMLALQWDWSGVSGPKEIENTLSSSQHGFSNVNVISSGGLAPVYMTMGGQYVQAGFTFDNKFGSGRGLVRLVNIGPEQWKAWTVFTRLEELKPTKPVIGTNGVDTDLQVLVVGAGQAGLATAAHLQALGIRYKVIDANPRIGDSWRNRYDILISHTPSYGDHFPYLRYPDDWPLWASRDDMADWQEHYVKTMNLDVATSTHLLAADYNEQTRTYHVHLKDATGTHTITTKHLVLATGFFNPTPRIPSLSNQPTFKGEVYHTSAHKSASHIPSVTRKKIVVIGTGTSAHDVAQDFVQHNAASVTMIQRGPIYSISRPAIEATITATYKIPGMKLDEADIVGNSFAQPLVLTIAPGMSQVMSAMDKEMLDRLEAKGLRVKRGEDGDSVLNQLFTRLGSIYIDQGANEMIADGRIGIVGSEGGVKGYYEEGIVLEDGRRVEADVVVLATGFEPSSKTVEKLLGPEVKKRVGDIGELDAQKERVGWFRPTGMPGLWYMTGSFSWARQYSGILALQIKAIEEGMNPGYYQNEGFKADS